MFVDQLVVAIGDARSDARLVELNHAVLKAHYAKALNDDDAQRLTELIHARRTATRATEKPVGGHARVRSIFPPRRYQRSPDRSQSIERRRLLAASGPMPPSMASRFTTGELAVLRIVANEVLQHGHCELCVDAIAARAGVCRRLAQNALRLAKHLALLAIQERRQRGRKNDPNLIRIVSTEWLQWLAKGSRSSSGSLGRRIGCKTMHPTDTKILYQKNIVANPVPNLGPPQGQKHQDLSTRHGQKGEIARPAGKPIRKLA